ncbi:MAG: hypothetical protein ABIV28_07745 [Longimicrobiales bacterium]
MHSEHLQNVTVGRVVGGWLVAIAVTSLVMLVLTALGMSDVEAGWWSLIAVVAGFFVGGMFSGMRALQAPVLHGIAIGLTSLVAWVVVNVIAYGLASGSFVLGWASMSATMTLALLLAQIVAAVVGALIGYNIALRGKPGLSEHEPVV